MLDEQEAPVAEAQDDAVDVADAGGDDAVDLADLGGAVQTADEPAVTAEELLEIPDAPEIPGKEELTEQRLEEASALGAQAAAEDAEATADDPQAAAEGAQATADDPQAAAEDAPEATAEDAPEATAEDASEEPPAEEPDGS